MEPRTLKARPHHRDFDRAVKLAVGEKLLIVDGEDELFLQQTAHGVEIRDARSKHVEVEIRMDLHDGKDNLFGSNSPLLRPVWKP